MKLARGPDHEGSRRQGGHRQRDAGLDQGWWYGSRNLTTKTKQVTKPEDVKGSKIRTMAVPSARLAMSSLGAVVTPMAVAELYSAMQMGVVEGQENPLNTIFTSKYYEVQKYLALTGHMTQNQHIIVNDKWSSRASPPSSEDLLQAGWDAGDYQSDLQLKANKANLQDLKDKGMVVTEVNKKEFAKTTENAWKEFESMFGKGFYEKVKAETSK